LGGLDPNVTWFSCSIFAEAIRGKFSFGPPETRVVEMVSNVFIEVGAFRIGCEKAFVDGLWDLEVEINRPIAELQ
jgi:hypothetical protein